MNSFFSRFFSSTTFSPSSSSVITNATSETTASSSSMVLPSSETDDQVSSNKIKMKNNAATDSKGKDHVLLLRGACFAAKRLRKEIQIMFKDPPTYCSTGPVDDCGIFNWRGAIFGPDDTPFEGGVFFLSIRFPEDYPIQPPWIKFVTKIFHPNIDKFGNIELDILRRHKWAAFSITKVLISIRSFLDNPNADEPTNRIATIYREDRQRYDTIARAWTRKYAMG